MEAEEGQEGGTFWDGSEEGFNPYCAMKDFWSR